MKTLFRFLLNGKLVLPTRMMLILLLAGVNISAQDYDENKTLSPYFVVLSDNPNVDCLPLKSTYAHVNIVGVIADVTVTQEYKNEGKSALEAIYTFPASTNAAVYAMEMIIGDRKIVARIEEKDKAREQYEQAKSEGKRTSLLEQDRPNVFQMNVANIMPGDIIQVTLKYTEMLIPEAGVYKFVYPTVVGPRYSEKGSAGDQFVNTPYTKEGSLSSYDFNIDINISAGMPLQNISSKTHKININYPTSDFSEVKLDPTENKGGNRDFILEYKLAGNAIESGLLLYKHKDENFFLVMVQPPKKIVKEAIPPREYIFIVDVSGSMQGFPISVTKKLMRNLIVNLRPTDKFNVMVFESSSVFLSDVSLPATIDNVEKANRFIDSQNGGGGTNLLAAMTKALSFPRTNASLSRSFIVVTDGYISVEKEVFDLIRKNNDNANLFAFGIGSSVNRFLIEGMAHIGMSEPLMVLDQSEADAEAEKFRNYISNPVLTQVKKVISGFEAYDVEPLTIPDVLAERPVIIYGKYKGEPKGTITIKGATGTGNYKKTFDVASVKPDEKNSAIRYLWARKRIQMLDDYAGLSYSDDNKMDVTSLGLKYNLMTAYTSFIAIEEDRVANEGSITTVKQPLPLPQGVPNSAIGFEMEIDEIDVPVYLHKEIVIMSDFQKEIKEKIRHKIEADLLTNQRLYFGESTNLPDAIIITVDNKGKTTNVLVEGQNISKEMEQRLIQQLMKINFASLKISVVWKYKIIF